jgi:hypothetical protein
MRDKLNIQEAQYCQLRSRATQIMKEARDGYYNVEWPTYNVGPHMLQPSQSKQIWCVMRLICTQTHIHRAKYTWANIPPHQCAHTQREREMTPRCKHPALVRRGPCVTTHTHAPRNTTFYPVTTLDITTISGGGKSHDTHVQTHVHTQLPTTPHAALA